jgi:predicted Rossmann-fold nucleotide-binding protein
VHEIHDADALRAWFASGRPLHDVRIQGLDLGDFRHELRARTDLRGLAVFGGRVPGRLARHLIEHGALVFPRVPDAPVDSYRPTLYLPSDLYLGLDDGYAATPDARAYTWAQDASVAHDALVTAMRALHDDSMSDALAEVLDGLPAVGVMGGHGLQRGTAEFARAAELGQLLSATGRVVLTGGGPGAMEAANLGAYAGPGVDLGPALAELGSVPTFTDIQRWASAALRVRADLDLVRAGTEPPDRPRSIGIPTWFYGHEPPNVFCDGIAKYFSNALREDWLLALSTGGVVVLPGAAGTVQEIFQAVTPRYYDTGKSPVAALVLVGREHWTETVPVWPLLQALGEGRAFSSRCHLVDELAEVPALLD